MAYTRDEKLKIAMLGHKRVPSREGGIEVVVEELSTRMAAMGHCVTCYNRRGHHVSGREYDVGNVSEYNGVRIKRVFTIQKGGLAAVSSSVFGAIRAAFGRYDVVHFHAEGPCAMLWLPKLFGKRCIATIHGLDHLRSKWGRFASWYIRFGEKCAVRYADELIVLSQNVQQYFKATYGRETVYIPNGVSYPEQKPAVEIDQRYGLKGQDYLLFVGRLVPEKGLRYLVDAYKKVHTDKRLVIAGGASDTGEFEQELHNMAADDPRILFTGFVQGHVLEELYSNAYLYILPSDVEGMPLTLLEAMSYRNCCVISDIPECTEVLEHYGYSFRRGNVEELTAKLQQLCDGPTLVEQGKSDCADYICSRHSWDTVVDATLRLYRGEEVLAEVSGHESLVGQ